ncbi:serine/threonine-protein kinase [Nonomuraea typhae]|uniref:serine/threonine-protein kinase n=1 Tax=Nonomuraea typhae TaxID=2603600 RepID=UPI001CA59E7C|nr:serine/threonine protein kinase [Nonomuraea typhae]
MSDISLPGYEIRGVIGQGGFGIVYLALQSAVGREVALKVDNRVLLSERDRRRFLREVTAAGALSGHPHVVPVYDAGLLPDGRPYMVLELCPGGSLAGKRLSPAEVRDAGVRIADALAAAHAQGVLHRDVKPGNILINRYGHVALSDFGLATMPESGPDASVTRESLTPAYAPPEAFELAGPSPAGDVYSLAATLYALLSGRPPRFPESGIANLAAILALHRLPVPDVPGVPPQLTAVLRDALATDPAHRTPSAAALRDALAAVHVDPATPVRQAAPSPAFQPAPPGYPGVPSQPATSPPGYPGVPSQPATSPPGDASTRSSRRAGRKQARKGVGLVAALVVAVGAGAAVGVYALRGPGATTLQPGPSSSAKTGQASPAAFPGLDTYTENCPAAKVKGAGAACVKESECWGGLAIVAGDTRARRLGCEEKHSWETFAVGRIPADSETYDQQDLERHPTIKKVCGVATMLASRRGKEQVERSRWMTTVLPPSAARFEKGDRVYRCVGGVTGREAPGQLFR